MSDSESCLDRALAAKGIGPKGLKPLSDEDIRGLIREITEGQHPEALAAATMMGFQVLERDSHEREVFEKAVQEVSSQLSPELNFIANVFTQNAEQDIEVFLKKLANLEDLTPSECESGVEFLIQSEAPDTYKAAFLQGLRVKRESDAENLALFGKLFSMAPRKELTSIPRLIDWSDPYDGMSRHANLSFLGAVVLSALGFPVVIHSSKNLGPKYGETFFDYFEFKRPLNLSTAEQSLDELKIAVLDQDQVFPELAALKPLRNAMRKRPFLATVEKMLMPLKASKSTILVTGYVHKAYKTAIPAMVMDHGVYDKIFLVKGIEGSVLLDPSKKIPAILRENETNLDLELVMDNRGESPKSELNACDIGKILKGEDKRWLTLEFSVLKIIEFTLGEHYSKDIILEMNRLKNEGLFLAHFKKVRDFFLRSGADESKT